MNTDDAEIIQTEISGYMLMKKILLSLVLPLLLIPASGCLYLHNQDRQDISEAAKDEYQKAIQQGTVSNIVATYNARQAMDDEFVAAFHQKDDKTQLVALLGKQWGELVNNTKKELKDTNSDIANWTAKKAVRVEPCTTWQL